MNVFLAGVPGGGSMGDCIRERELTPLFNKRLWSYFHLINGGKMKKLKNKVDLFLDSGAFSAWTLGTTININEYINFIKENEEFIEVYANLDVIGLGGAQPNKETAKRTLENQKIMESAGVRPMPCYHLGEPIKYLKYYIENYDYIAIGVAGNSGAKLIPILDDLWANYLTDSEGIPRCKVHGFAVTSLVLMLRYPWYSVDSTSWVVTGRMGSIYVPKYKAGQWIYDENSWKIAVSNKSPNLKEAGQHIETLTPLNKKILLNYIHDKCYILGKSEFKFENQSYELKENEKWASKKPADKNEKREVEIIIEEGVSNKYQLRDELNIIYFLDLEKSIQPWPWKFVKKSNANSFF